MAFNLAIGFENIPIPDREKDKTKLSQFSVLLADTVVVMKEEAKVYTKVSKAWAKVHYNIDLGDNKDPADDKENGTQSIKDVSGPRTTRNQVIQSRLRDQQRQLEGKETDQERRERHQKELMKRKQEEAIQRMKEGGGKSKAAKALEVFRPAYETSKQYPSAAKGRQIVVDMRNEAVLLPINGTPTPFHISTIKNVSK